MSVPSSLTIPLLPLPTVLFPGGRLSLQIFETRYLDMVKHCLREHTGFGLVLILEGEQSLLNQDDPLPSISEYGTYCTIVDFDQLFNGMLSILVEGQTKFVIQDQYEQADRLMLADVKMLASEDKVKVPKAQQHLITLLETLMEHRAIQRLGLDCDMRLAGEVSARLAELLPCPNHFKQRLLEMKSPITRLRELDKLVERLQKGR